MTASPKTVAEVLKAAAEHLAGRNVDQPRLAAELLASRLLNCKRLELYLRYDTILSDKLVEAMRRGTKRVADGEPVQYVIGQWDFMGRVFKVDRRALIPRPETETLVEQVLQCAPLWRTDAGRRPRIADVGTGCGCIVISLALEKPAASYLALDPSEEALELARGNASAYGLGEKIIFAGAELSDLVEPATLDAIVSNPPYVATADWEKLPIHIRNHEPRMALDGGPDGLSVIEPLVEDASIVLKPGGLLFLEVGETQGQKTASFLKEYGFEEISIRKDLNNRDRVAVGRLPEAPGSEPDRQDAVTA